MKVARKAGIVLTAAMALSMIGVVAAPASPASAAACGSGIYCYQEVGGPYLKSLENCKNDHWTRYLWAQRQWPNKSIHASGCFRTNVDWGWNYVITVYK